MLPLLADRYVSLNPMDQAIAELEWGGQSWQLRPDCTVYWASAKTLILADPHFGKAQFFRGSGIPVPSGTTQRNLDKIDLALHETGARRMVILGDFFHSRRGVTPDLLNQLQDWRSRNPTLEIINTQGNHDRQAGDPPASLAIKCLPSASYDPEDPSIAFAHEPTSLPNAATLCGHLHPCIQLHGLANRRMRAACFHFTHTTAVLPAFGAFTGMKTIYPKRHDRVFAVGPDAVIEVSLSVSGSTA